ncbi:hypothetical protein D3C72_2170840 [compost metagenome]
MDRVDGDQPRQPYRNLLSYRCRPVASVHERLLHSQRDRILWSLRRQQNLQFWRIGSLESAHEWRSFRELRSVSRRYGGARGAQDLTSRGAPGRLTHGMQAEGG